MFNKSNTLKSSASSSTIFSDSKLKLSRQSSEFKLSKILITKHKKLTNIKLKNKLLHLSSIQNIKDFQKTDSINKITGKKSAFKNKIQDSVSLINKRVHFQDELDISNDNTLIDNKFTLNSPDKKRSYSLSPVKLRSSNLDNKSLRESIINIHSNSNNKFNFQISEKKKRNLAEIIEVVSYKKYNNIYWSKQNQDDIKSEEQEKAKCSCACLIF